MTVLMVCAVFVIGAVLVAGVCLKGQALTTDFTRKNIAPCIQYPFGTDWMGRDMFVRTLTTTNARTIIWHQFCFLLFFKLLKVLLDTELDVS